jgi:hypothetical protein
MARLNAPSQSPTNYPSNGKANTQQQSPFAGSQLARNQQMQNPFEQNQLARTQQPDSMQYQRSPAQTQLGQTMNPQSQFNSQLNQPQLTQTQSRQPQSPYLQRMDQQRGYPQATVPVTQPSIYRTDLSQQRPPIDRDPPSLSNRSLDSSIGSTPRSEPKQVAAQPLFNGLLLLSFVANIYLMFWLKNLRLQFRDLVAAKRMANANTPAV